ncbi:hypothetical protein GEMRC1_001888 [Eukaryota sp. GEM-RC1]
MFNLRWGPTKVKLTSSVLSNSPSLLSSNGVSSTKREPKPPLTDTSSADTHHVESQPPLAVNKATIISYLENRKASFRSLLTAPLCSLDRLRQLSWSGVPIELRCDVWPLLLGCSHLDSSKRHTTFTGKRRKYYASSLKHSLASQDPKTIHQIAVDLPRTATDLQFIQHPRVYLMLSNILLLWAIRHPAAGYVQGMNDLVLPFLLTLLYPHQTSPESFPHYSVDNLSDDTLDNVEADLYSMFEKFMDKLQSCYIDGNREFQFMVKCMDYILKSNSTEIHAHFKAIGLDYQYFGFRWMSCLLFRELPYEFILRLVDTYLSEDNFLTFHICVCVAVIQHLKTDLLAMDFPTAIMYLQDLKSVSSHWPLTLFEEILSQAFVIHCQYAGRLTHLKDKEERGLELD